MAVPITFLDKYNADQFEIFGIMDRAISSGLRTKKYEKAEVEMQRFVPDDGLPRRGLFWIFLAEKNNAAALPLVDGDDPTPDSCRNGGNLQRHG